MFQTSFLGVERGLATQGYLFMCTPLHDTPHTHSLYTHLSSRHRERFLALLALGGVPVVDPHTLPHHRTVILHVCYLLLGTAGGRSVIVVDVIPGTPALQCEYICLGE